MLVSSSSPSVTLRGISSFVLKDAKDKGLHRYVDTGVCSVEFKQTSISDFRGRALKDLEESTPFFEQLVAFTLHKVSGTSI